MSKSYEAAQKLLSDAVTTAQSASAPFSEELIRILDEIGSVQAAAAINAGGFALSTAATSALETAVAELGQCTVNDEIHQALQQPAQVYQSQSAAATVKRTVIDLRAAALKRIASKMTELSLQPPDLATEIQRWLKLKGIKRKGDKTAIRKVLNGQTKRPHPSIQNALFDALKFNEEAENELRLDLGWPEKTKKT